MHDTARVKFLYHNNCGKLMVLAHLLVFKMKLVVNHIVQHHTHANHMEERGHPGVFASDVPGSVCIHPSTHCRGDLRETSILYYVLSGITDTELTKTG